MRALARKIDIIVKNDDQNFDVIKWHDENKELINSSLLSFNTTARDCVNELQKLVQDRLAEREYKNCYDINFKELKKISAKTELNFTDLKQEYNDPLAKSNHKALLTILQEADIIDPMLTDTINGCSKIILQTIKRGDQESAKNMLEFFKDFMHGAVDESINQVKDKGIEKVATSASARLLVLTKAGRMSPAIILCSFCLSAYNQPHIWLEHFEKCYKAISEGHGYDLGAELIKMGIDADISRSLGKAVKGMCKQYQNVPEFMQKVTEVLAKPAKIQGIKRITSPIKEKIKIKKEDTFAEFDSANVISVRNLLKDKPKWKDFISTDSLDADKAHSQALQAAYYFEKQGHTTFTDHRGESDFKDQNGQMWYVPSMGLTNRQAAKMVEVSHLSYKLFDAEGIFEDIQKQINSKSILVDISYLNRKEFTQLNTLIQNNLSNDQLEKVSYIDSRFEENSGKANRFGE